MPPEIWKSRLLRLVGQVGQVFPKSPGFQELPRQIRHTQSSRCAVGIRRRTKSHVLVQPLTTPVVERDTLG